MVRLGREVRSRKEYILGSDLRIFHYVAVWNPQHNSYHYMVMGCLHGASQREHSLYLGQRARLPLRFPGRQTRTQSDKIFDKLRSSVPKPDKRAARHNSWISEETWRLIEKSVSVKGEPRRCQERLQLLGRVIRTELKEYIRRRVDTS